MVCKKIQMQSFQPLLYMLTPQPSLKDAHLGGLGQLLEKEKHFYERLNRFPKRFLKILHTFLIVNFIGGGGNADFVVENCKP